MPALRGMDYLKSKLAIKKARVQKRYTFYEMKNVTMDFGISTPPGLEFWMSSLGWCGRAVDSLSDRLLFREFDNDIYDINSIFDENNKDILIDSAILSALISSCSFIYITTEDEYPRLRVIDGRHATGIIDPITNMLKEGYAVLEFDNSDNPITEAYFIPGLTTIYEHGKVTHLIRNDARYPLLVPVINRPDAVRPFGHSRISRACMSIMSSAIRTVKRSEISAEFYSYPQKYAVGLDPDAEPMDSWKATMSHMLAITKDKDGDHPVMGAFQQQSMTPHADQLRMFAGLFAGETGLTLDDLGFPSQNPSSAEAIKSSHESLRLMARKAQRDFSIGLLNAGYLAACIRDKQPYFRHQLANVIPKWEPIFEPDAAMLSTIGDGVIKINQGVPGYFSKSSLRDLTGIEGGTEDQEIFSPSMLDEELGNEEE